MNSAKILFLSLFVFSGTVVPPPATSTIQLATSGPTIVTDIFEASPLSPGPGPAEPPSQNATLSGIRLDPKSTSSTTPDSPGTVSVYGRWLFYESDYDPGTQTGTIRPIRRAYAELWDSDAFAEVGPLATTNTGEDGFFYFPPVENTDGFLEGTLDVYVKLFMENSIVKVRAQCCDGPYQFKTPVFSNVPDGDFLVGHWHMVGSSRGSAAIFDTIEIGYDYALSLGHTHNKVTIIWPGPDNFSSTELDGVTINITGGGGDQDEWDEDDILHEYGHSVQFHVYGGWIPNTALQHSWNQCVNNNLAFSEGWAYFWAVAANFERGYGDALYPRDTWARDQWQATPDDHDLEADQHTIGTTPACRESVVAGILWDVYDANNDDQFVNRAGADSLSSGMGPVWDVFSNFITAGHHVYTILEFWNGWFARGHACQGCTSAQQVWGIYMDHGLNQDPNAPQNPNAASGSHTPSVWSNDNTIFASWTGATDDLSGVEGYSFVWTTSSTTIPDTTIDVTVASATSQVLADGNSWWLHLRTRDFAGNWNPGAFHWGPFFIDTTPPSAPVLLSPADGLWTSSTTITFTWQASTDNLSGVASYSFQQISFFGVGTLCCLTTTSHTLTGLTALDWSWRVSAVDTAGNQAWSATWSFFIDTVPPSTPAPLSPTNGATTTSRTPTFTWSASTDDRSGLASYTLQLDTSSSFNSANLRTQTGITTTTFTPTQSLDVATWYWRVIAVDVVGNQSPYSAAYSILITDFSVTANPTTVWVAQSSTGSTTITVQSINSFTGTVTLSVIGLPAGTSASFVPSQVTLGPGGQGTLTLTVSATGTATTGTYTVTVTGTGGGLSHSLPVTIRLIPSQTSFSRTLMFSGVTATVTSSFTANTATSKSLAGSTVLNAVNSATGAPVVTATVQMTLTFNDNGGARYVLEINVSPYWLAVSCNMNVSDGSASCIFTRTPDIDHSGAITIIDASILSAAFDCSQGMECYNPAADLDADGTVTIIDASIISLYYEAPVFPPPDFSISVTPSSVSIASGRSGSVTVQAQSLNGYTGSISLSIWYLPACVTPSFTKNPLQVPTGGNDQSTLNLNVGASCPAATNYVYVQGVDAAGVSHSTTFWLFTQAFTVGVAPQPVGIAKSSCGDVTVTVYSGNSYSGSVTLSKSGFPSTISATFLTNPVSVPAGGTASSTLHLCASNTNTIATYATTISGSDNIISRSTTFTILLNDYQLSASPDPTYVVVGGSSSTTITVSKYFGVSKTLTISVTGVPACVSYTLNPTRITLPNGGQSTLSMTSSTSCTVGDYTITVRADASGTAYDRQDSFVLTIYVGGGGGSVMAGTLVTLADGTRVPVQNLKVGDRVLSYDILTGETIATTITDMRSVTVDNLVVIRLLDGTTIRTDNNPLQKFWVMKPDCTASMVGVPDIQVGDYLFHVSTRTWVQIIDKQYITGGSFTMFDISTTAPSNYIVNDYLDPGKT